MYKCGDFVYRKINEQVEYLTELCEKLLENYNPFNQKIKDLESNKQDKVDDTLNTASKEVAGSINELLTSLNDLRTTLNSKIDANKEELTSSITQETTRATTQENQIKQSLSDYERETSATLLSHTNSISSINDNINDLNNNKQPKVDNDLLTENKTIVGAINENRDNISSNETLIDTKQAKQDYSLQTIDKTIVGAINEINGNIRYHESLYQHNISINFANAYTGDNIIYFNCTLYSKDSAPIENSVQLSKISNNRLRNLVMTIINPEFIWAYDYVTTGNLQRISSTKYNLPFTIYGRTNGISQPETVISYELDGNIKDEVYQVI